MTDDRKLEVYCHGSPVGYLAETSDHMVAFQYSEGWIRNGFSNSNKSKGFFPVA